LTTFTDHRHPSIADFQLPIADCSDHRHLDLHNEDLTGRV